MDYLFSFLKKDFVIKNQKILDAASGYGRLMHFLNEFDLHQNYYGFDYIQELVNKGNNDFDQYSNIKFENHDLLKISEKFYKKFDITILYKTLYCAFEYYEEVLKELIKVTKNKIYITSTFYDGDVDFITKIYLNASNNSKIYSFSNSYSYPKFEKFCKSCGVKNINSVKMQLDFDLPPPQNSNDIQTYTMLDKNNKRLEVCGNVIMNWKLVELVL